MSRVFLMKWYHFSVEYFEDLRNVNHCEFLIMRKNEESGKYLLENKLRTWSELRRERAQLLVKEKGGDGKDGKENGNSKESKLDCAPSITPGVSSSVVASPAAVETRRRWGGCPNGCNHDKNFKIRQALADLVQSDNIISSNGVNGTGSGKGGGTGVVNGATTVSSASSSATKTTVPDNDNKHNKPTTTDLTGPHGPVNPSFNGTANSQTIVSRRPAAKRFQSSATTNGNSETDGPVPEIPVIGPSIDVTKAREEIVSSPDGTPSFISVEDRLRNHLKSPNPLHPSPRPTNHLHVGRDFGGTYSGHNSVVASDADSSEDERHRRQRGFLKEPALSNGTSKGENGVINGTNGTTLSPNLLPHFSRDRNQSRMGRGTRACRLGDHPHSSDGEHEADCEHEDEGAVTGGSTSEQEDGGGLTKTLTDEADGALLEMAERADRSIQGSVY